MVLLRVSKLHELSQSTLKDVNAQVLNYRKINQIPNWKKACLN